MLAGEEFWILLLFQEVYSMAVFPFPQLAELREKYTYNITPFPTTVKSNGRFVHTEEFLLIYPCFAPVQVFISFPVSKAVVRIGDF